MVLWHAYPVIGIDDRNQWDFYRDVDGLRELVADLHAAGVKVFVDYNPWDTGTRRSRDDATELAALVAELEIDGVFLDTLKEGGAELLDGLAAARAGVAVEGESTLPLERLADHPLSWAQWFADSPTPGVRPLALVRAPAPDAPRAPLAPRPRRGAPVGMAQRDGRDGLGGRLRGLGRLVRPRRPDPAPDDPGPAGAAPPVRRRRLDASGRPR